MNDPASGQAPVAYNVVIVGAGHAGAQAAVALRQNGFNGSIALVGEERELPYERPPLSKDYLSGAKAFERILIRPASFWQERAIGMMVGTRVTAVDPIVRRLTTDTQGTIGYSRMIWAAGGHARRLGCDGHDLEGVHSVRCRADVDRLKGELTAAKHVVVIGGGYIGLEAAAVLAKFNKRVMVIESQDRVLARVAGMALSRFYEGEHRAHGVDLRLNTAVDHLVGERGRVSGVRLASGEVVRADMVIVGIGIVPAVAPLLAAGAAGTNGVLVDKQGRTSLPDILAVGDCAQHENRFASDRLIRLESVQNANDMASVAARTIMGIDARYDAVPWFWSNQYDLRLQTVGLSIGHDREVVRGDPATRSFSIVYLREGRVKALDCVNATRDYVQGKQLVANASVVDEAALADASVPLKTLGTD